MLVGITTKSPPSSLSSLFRFGAEAVFAAEVNPLPFKALPIDTPAAAAAAVKVEISGGVTVAACSAVDGAVVGAIWRAAVTSTTLFDELIAPWVENAVVAAGGATAGTGDTDAGGSASVGADTCTGITGAVGSGAGAVGCASAGASAGGSSAGAAVVGAGAAAASTAATAAAVSVAISGGPRLPSCTGSICPENLDEEIPSEEDVEIGVDRWSAVAETLLAWGCLVDVLALRCAR